MAFNKDQLYKDCLREAEKNKLFWIEDVCAFVGVSKPTFYDYFPVDSNELNAIKNTLTKNKIQIKAGIRNKLYKGKGSELIALYKILATEDELRALNGQYVDHTSKGEKINITPIQFNDNAKKIDD